MPAYREVQVISKNEGSPKWTHRSEVTVVESDEHLLAGRGGIAVLKQIVHTLSPVDDAGVVEVLVCVPRDETRSADAVLTVASNYDVVVEVRVVAAVVHLTERGTFKVRQRTRLLANRKTAHLKACCVPIPVVVRVVETAAVVVVEAL